jgi:hypothetical protein
MRPEGEGTRDSPNSRAASRKGEGCQCREPALRELVREDCAYCRKPRDLVYGERATDGCSDAADGCDYGGAERTVCTVPFPPDAYGSGIERKKERKKERKIIYFPKHSVNNMVMVNT